MHGHIYKMHGYAYVTLGRLPSYPAPTPKLLPKLRP
jgi:hypothetical protein